MAVLRNVAERLAGLRGVDPVEGDLYLLVLGVEPGEGVAVRDADHAEVGRTGLGGGAVERREGRIIGTKVSVTDNRASPASGSTV